jgi:alkyl hydroperoxide reductase subunit AhpF
MPDRPATAPTIVRDRPRETDASHLEVYVSAECPNCSEAVRLAHEAAARYPDIVVSVIDLAQLQGNPPPDPVVAVPTYLLNGRVVSLGNPYTRQLFALLQEAGG